MIKRITAAILVTLMFCISLSLSGCGGQKATSTTPPVATNTNTNTNASRTVTNLDGSVITVPAEVNRIATVFGPAYEKVVVLGAEDKIIADGDLWLALVKCDLQKVEQCPWDSRCSYSVKHRRFAEI